MNRSKNHLLFELYLEELGASDVYEATKHISLGHIVKWTNEGHEFPDNIEDYSEKDFAISASFKELASFDDNEMLAIESAVDKINHYHQNKNND